MDISVEPLKILQEQFNALIAALVASAPNALAALLVLALTWGLATLLARLTTRVFVPSRARPSLRRALATLTKIAVWTTGLLIAATVLFPNLTPTKLLAGLGLGSIAIGLAFRDIFENFLAGLLILFRKPMRIGDDIECDDISGQVEEITIRDTHIRKRSGELLLVPNSYIFKNPTTILTDRDKRRLSLVVGVAYGEDVDQSREAIRQAVEGLDSVDKDIPVEVFADEFASSSINLQVRWWTKSAPPDAIRSRDEVIAAIKAKLDEANIEIPFPYRTLTFKEPLRVEKE